MDEDREKYLSDLYYDTSGSGGLGGGGREVVQKGETRGKVSDE